MSDILEVDPPLPAEAPPQPPAVPSVPQDVYSTYMTMPSLPPAWIPPPMHYPPPSYPHYQVPPAYQHYPSHQPPAPAFQSPAYSMPTQPPPPLGTCRHPSPNEVIRDPSGLVRDPSVGLVRDPRVQMRRKSLEKDTEILRPPGDDKVKITLNYKPRPIAAVGPNNIHEAEFNVESCKKSVETSIKTKSDTYSEKSFKIEGIVSKLKDTINDSVNENIPVVEKKEEIKKSAEANRPGDEPYDPFNADEERESGNSTNQNKLSEEEIRKLNDKISNCFSFILSNSEERKRLTPTVEAINAKKLEIKNKANKIESQKKTNIYDSISSKQSVLLHSEAEEHNLSRFSDQLSSDDKFPAEIDIKKNVEDHINTMKSLDTLDKRSSDINTSVGFDMIVPPPMVENNTDILYSNTENNRESFESSAENTVILDVTKSGNNETSTLKEEIIELDKIDIRRNVEDHINTMKSLDTPDKRSSDINTSVGGGMIVPPPMIGNSTDVLDSNAENNRESFESRAENTVILDVAKSSGNNETSKLKEEIIELDKIDIKRNVEDHINTMKSLDTPDKRSSDINTSVGGGMFVPPPMIENRTDILDFNTENNIENVESKSENKKIFEREDNTGCSSSLNHVGSDKNDVICPVREDFVNIGSKSKSDVAFNLVESCEKSSLVSLVDENCSTIPKDLVGLPDSNESKLPSNKEIMDYDDGILKRGARIEVFLNEGAREGANTLSLPPSETAIDDFKSKALSFPTKAELKRFPSPETPNNSIQSDVQESVDETNKNLSVLEIKGTEAVCKTDDRRSLKRKHTVSRKDQPRKSNVSHSFGASTYNKKKDLYVDEPKSLEVKNTEIKKAKSKCYDKIKRKNSHVSHTTKPIAGEKSLDKIKEEKLKTPFKGEKCLKEKESHSEESKNNLEQDKLEILDEKTSPRTRKPRSKLASPLSKKSQSFISQNLPTTLNLIRDAELIRIGFNKTPRIILKRIPITSLSGPSKCYGSSLEDRSSKNVEVKSNFSSKSLVNVGDSGVSVCNISFKDSTESTILSESKICNKNSTFDSYVNYVLSNSTDWVSKETLPNDDLGDESVVKQSTNDKSNSEKEENGILLNDCSGLSREEDSDILDCKKSNGNQKNELIEDALHNKTSPVDQSTLISSYYEGIIRTLNKFQMVRENYIQPRKSLVLTIPKVEDIPEIKVKDSVQRMLSAVKKQKTGIEQYPQLRLNYSEESKAEDEIMKTADSSQSHLAETESAVSSSDSCKSSDANESRNKGDVDDSLILDKELSDLAKGCLDVNYDPSDESSLDGDFPSCSSRGKLPSAFNLKKKRLSKKLQPLDGETSLKPSGRNKSSLSEQETEAVPIQVAKSLDCEQKSLKENDLDLETRNEETNCDGKCKISSLDEENLSVNTTLTGPNKEETEMIVSNTNNNSNCDCEIRGNKEVIKNVKSVSVIQGYTNATSLCSNKEPIKEYCHGQLSCVELQNLVEIDNHNKPTRRTRRRKQLQKVKVEPKQHESALTKNLVDSVTANPVPPSKELTKEIIKSSITPNFNRNMSEGTENVADISNIDSLLDSSISQSLDITNNDIENEKKNVQEHFEQTDFSTSSELKSTSWIKQRETRQTQKTKINYIISKTTNSEEPKETKLFTKKRRRLNDTHKQIPDAWNKERSKFQPPEASFSSNLPPFCETNTESRQPVSRKSSTESNDEPLIVVKERLLADKVNQIIGDGISQKINTPLNLNDVDIKSSLTSCAAHGASEKTKENAPNKSSSSQRETTDKNGGRGFNPNINKFQQLQPKDIHSSDEESDLSSSDEEEAINLIIRKDSPALPGSSSGVNCFTSNKDDDLINLKIKEALRKKRDKAEVDAEIKKRLAEIDELEKTAKSFQSSFSDTRTNKNKKSSAKELLNPAKWASSNDCLYMSTDDSGDNTVLNYSKSADSRSDKTRETSEHTYTEELSSCRAAQAKTLKNDSRCELNSEQNTSFNSLPVGNARLTKIERNQVQEAQNSNECHLKFNLMQSQVGGSLNEVINNKARRSARKKIPSKILRGVDSEEDLFNATQNELRDKNNGPSGQSEPVKTQHFLPEPSVKDLKRLTPFAFDHLKSPDILKSASEVENQFSLPITQPAIDKIALLKNSSYKGSTVTTASLNNSSSIENQNELNKSMQDDSKFEQFCQAPEPDSSTPTLTRNCLPAACDEGQSISKNNPQFLEASFSKNILSTQDADMVESSLSSNTRELRRKPSVQRQKRRNQYLKRHSSKLQVSSDKTSDSFNSGQTDSLSEEIVSSSVSIRLSPTNKRRKRKSCVDLLMDDSMLSAARDILMTPNPYLAQSFEEESGTSTFISKNNITSDLEPAMKEIPKGSAPKSDLLANKLKLLEKLKNVNRKNRKTRQCRTLVCYNEDSLPESLVDSPVSESAHGSEKSFLPQEEVRPFNTVTPDDFSNETIENSNENSEAGHVPHKNLRILKPRLCKSQLNKIRKSKKHKITKRGKTKNVRKPNHSVELSSSVSAGESLNKGSSSTTSSKANLQTVEDVSKNCLGQHISEFDKLLQSNPTVSSKMNLKSNNSNSSSVLFEEDKSNEASDYFYNSFPSPLQSDSEDSATENPIISNNSSAQQASLHSKTLHTKPRIAQSLRSEKIICSIPKEKIAKTLSLFEEKFLYPVGGEKSSDGDDDDIPLSVKLLQYKTENSSLHSAKEDLSSHEEELKIQSSKQSMSRKRTLRLENLYPVRKSKRSSTRSHFSYNLDSEDSGTTNTEISDCNRDTLSDSMYVSLNKGNNKASEFSNDTDVLQNEDLKLDLSEGFVENRPATENSRNSSKKFSGTITSTVQKKKRGRPRKVQPECEKILVKDTCRDGEITTTDLKGKVSEEIVTFESPRRLTRNLKQELKYVNDCEGVKIESNESTHNSIVELGKSNKFPELKHNDLNSASGNNTLKTTRAKRLKSTAHLTSNLVIDEMTDSRENVYDVYDYLDDDELSLNETPLHKRVRMPKLKECLAVESKKNQEESTAVNVVDKKTTKQFEEDKLSEEPPCLIKTRTRRAKTQALENMHLEPPSLESQVPSVVKLEEPQNTCEVRTEFTKEAESSTVTTLNNDGDNNHLIHEKGEAVALTNTKCEAERVVLSEYYVKNTDSGNLRKNVNVKESSVKKKKRKGKCNSVWEDSSTQEKPPEDINILSDQDIEISLTHFQENSPVDTINILDENEMHHYTTLPNLSNSPDLDTSCNLRKGQPSFSGSLENAIKSQGGMRTQKTHLEQTGSILMTEASIATNAEDEPANSFDEENKNNANEQSYKANPFKTTNVSKAVNAFSVNPSLPPPMTRDQPTLWSRISMFLNKTTRSVATQVRSTKNLILKGCENAEPEVSLQNEVTLPEVIKALFEEFKSTDSSFTET